MPLRPLALVALLLGLVACRAEPPAPQLIRIDSAAPASQQPSSAPAEANPAPSQHTAISLMSFAVTPGREDSAASVLRGLLSSEGFRVSTVPGRIMVLAPEHMKEGIQQIVTDTLSIDQDAADSHTFELNYWLLRARPGSPDSSTLPELAEALKVVNEEQGPTRFELVERLSLLSGGGEFASAKGRQLDVDQRVFQSSGKLNGEFKIRVFNRPLIDTRLRIGLEQTIVLGSVGAQPELARRDGSELEFAQSEEDMLFVVVRVRQRPE
ncbi:MAG: hypothetical protein RBU37_02065 [Myxococcota bacterium]|jgi:hypothetical protein|nr:hypothetical protein [Myxococcota bacterium]